MDEDVLDVLEQLGYTGPLVEPETLTNAVKGGPKSIEYTQLVEWLSKELRGLCKLEDNVNAITNPDDSSSFLLEVSSFLKELNCPYQSLTEDNVNQRLQTVESRLLLLVYLGTEVQAARIIAFNEASSSKGMEVGVSESPTAHDLKSMLIALSVSKPPANITAPQLFSKIEAKIKERLSLLPAEFIKKPLFFGLLSPHQWNALSQLHKEMLEDYSLRRQMLLKRLDVTIQSFQWSGKAKQNKDAIAAKFGPLRRQLKVEPEVSLSNLLSSREDLAILEKTSSSNVRKNTQSSVNKVMIGRVPDRGGRPNEQRPPPPEMPSWQKRTDAAPGGRGGGARGDHRGGGRVQGGWSSGQGGHQQDSGGYQQDRGGYQQDRGGYQQDRGGYHQDRGGGGGGGRGGRGRGGGGHQGGRYQEYRQGGQQYASHGYDASNTYSHY